MYDNKFLEGGKIIEGGTEPEEELEACALMLNKKKARGWERHVWSTVQRNTAFLCSFGNALTGNLCCFHHVQNTPLLVCGVGGTNDQSGKVIMPMPVSFDISSALLGVLGRRPWVLTVSLSERKPLSCAVPTTLVTCDGNAITAW